MVATTVDSMVDKRAALKACVLVVPTVVSKALQMADWRASWWAARMAVCWVE